MKKQMIWLLGLCVMLLTVLLCAPASAAEGDFVIENGVLKDYTGTDANVVVPDGVTEIRVNAFAYNEKITSVTLPNGVTKIGHAAFKECTRLTTVKMPDTVTCIDASAFEDCTALKTITLSAGLTNLERHTFAGCSSLTSIIIPNGVTEVGIQAFCGCKKLAEVTLPDTLVMIWSSAFFDCISLKSIIIPGTVTQIYDDAFDYMAQEASWEYRGEHRKDLVIYGLSWSKAEEHAKKCGYKFVSIGELTIPTVGGFKDVWEEHYYAKPVLWAVEKGVTNGTSANTFSPDQTCTRAQIITFLWRAAGSPEVSHAGFADVSEQDYYYKATRWAAEMGIESGDMFKPNESCTRAMAVEFIWKACGSPEASESNFLDVARERSYASAVDWAVEKGVTNGTATNAFSPGQTCTRAQIVTFLWRAFAQ